MPFSRKRVMKAVWIDEMIPHPGKFLMCAYIGNLIFYTGLLKISFRRGYLWSRFHLAQCDIDNQKSISVSSFQQRQCGTWDSRNIYGSRRTMERLNVV